LTFVLGQKRAVAGLRHAVAADLAGAHRFWFGPLAAATPMRGAAVAARRPPIHAERKGGAAKGKKK
jgi:hypothetical protein